MGERKTNQRQHGERHRSLVSLQWSNFAAVLLLCLSACSSTPAFFTDLEASERETCFERQLPVPYQVCVYEEKGATRDVLYYLHGSGDWVHSFSRRLFTDGSFTARQRWLKEMRKRGSVPRIVTISFGRSALLNDERLKLTWQIMSEVETKLSDVRRRLLWGFSMGGHNALRMVFDRPDYFNKVVVAAPNLPRCNPFVDKTLLYICAYQQKPKSAPFQPESGLELATAFQLRDSYTEEEFQKANPFAMAERLNKDLPPLYLTVGTHDQFGLYPGTRLMAQALSAKKQKVIYREIEKGKHNEYPEKEIADFLTN